MTTTDLGMASTEFTANTVEPDGGSIHVPWGIIGGYMVVALVILLSNGLVIVSILKYRFLQTPMNSFVCALAAVDITMSLTIISKVVKLLRPDWYASQAACVVPLVFSSARALSTLAMLLAVAVERYLGTFKPLLYQNWINPARVRGVVAFSIIYPLLVSGIGLGVGNQWRQGGVCMYLNIHSTAGMAVVNIHLFFTLASTFVIYVRIFRTAQKLKLAVAPLPSHVEIAENQRIRENMAMINKFLIIVGLFALCWLPFVILTLIIRSDIAYYMNQPEVLKFYEASLMMLTINSFINPIVYALKFDNFRKAFKLLLKCRMENSTVAT